MTAASYKREQLWAGGQSRCLTDRASEAAFLLGGIGTGNVSLGARGGLRDWELFNNPGKGNYLPYTFFAIWAQLAGAQPVAKVLEARLHPPYSRSHGYYSGDLAGLPRLDGSTMRGEYPFVWIDFEDGDLPVTVGLEAYTPLIPLNPDDSGIPGAVLRYKVRNHSEASVAVTIAGSLANAVGFDGYELFFYPRFVGTPENEYHDDGCVRGILYRNSGLAADHMKYGSMALIVRDESVTIKESWLDGFWCDGIHDFWDDFCEDGKLEIHSSSSGTEGRLATGSKLRVGSLGIHHVLQPGEQCVFEFILTWHFPNRARAWGGHIIQQDVNQHEVVQNYYATLFSDAWHAGRYLVENLGRLEKGTRDFHRALFTSTWPPYVLDALAANITVLRSTTCFRLSDGKFLGWEGNFDQRGSCEGTCTHVWNYAQTLAFLFPQLEQSMRRVEFLLETDNTGKMAFRSNCVFGGPRWDMLPATDGQMGTIIRLCREWKLTGDDEFLRELWPYAARALDFAFDYWDSDGDCVLDSQQHNTYDIEFYGLNSLSNSMFFAALKAAAVMADYIGDSQRAAQYRHSLECGSQAMDELLWGGEYYIQVIDDVNAFRYQYGTGCLSDQVFGQLLAHVVGLGYILPEAHVKQAIASVYRYNFQPDLAKHHNVQRTYALNDEKGLLLCSWPHGGRPRFPFVYSQEVWTGVEYQVAAHLIYEGFVDEGLTIVKAVRERYDGYRRNPWNEVECGNHYARSMASWAVLLALSGFHCDLSRGEVAFAPVIDASTDSSSLRTFWSCGRGWGTYSQVRDEVNGAWRPHLEVLGGDMSGVKVRACGQEWTL
jgi:uncharacterized protein (DUF608 family)